MMGAYRMKINFDKFFIKLKENGISQKQFKDDTGLSSGVVHKLLHNQGINTETICRICDYFQCMPDEIMDWIPEAPSAEYLAKQKEKEETQAEIERLREKLKKM